MTPPTPPRRRPISRRTALILALGLPTLGAAGWWMRERHASAGALSDASSPEAKLNAALDALWQRSFDTPSGGPLRLADYRGQPLLLNFWATWCPPCVKELPLLDRFHREHSPRGWHVLGLALDEPAAVRDFLAHTPVHFAVALGGPGGAELTQALGNTQRALPFTLVLDAAGRIKARKLGACTASDLSAWAHIAT